MKKLLFLIFLISFAFFTSVLNAKELRAALIPLDEKMQNFADLILAESTGKKLPLIFLEREKLPEIKAEFILSRDDLSRNFLNNADLFCVLEQNKIIIFEGNFGIRIAEKKVSSVADALAVLSESHRKYSRYQKGALRRLSLTPAIAADFLVNKESFRAAEAKFRSFLVNHPDFIVLERRHLQLILDEPQPNKHQLLSGTILIRITENNGVMHIYANGQVRIWRTSDDPVDLADKLNALPPIKNDLPNEADFFAAEAEFFMNNGLFADAIVLAECANTLYPQKKYRKAAMKYTFAGYERQRNTVLNSKDLTNLHHAVDRLNSEFFSDTSRFISCFAWLETYRNFDKMAPQTQKSLRLLVRKIEKLRRKNLEKFHKGSTSVESVLKNISYSGEYPFDSYSFINFTIPDITAVLDTPEFTSLTEPDNLLNHKFRYLDILSVSEKNICMKLAKKLQESSFLNFVISGIMLEYRLTEQEQRNPEEVLKKILAAIPEKKVISPETFQLPEILTSYQFPVSSGCRKLMFDIAQNLYKKKSCYICWGINEYDTPQQLRESLSLLTDALDSAQKRPQTVTQRQSIAYCRTNLTMINAKLNWYEKRHAERKHTGRLLISNAVDESLAYDGKRFAYFIKDSFPVTELFRIDTQKDFVMEKIAEYSERVKFRQGSKQAFLLDDFYVYNSGKLFLFLSFNSVQARKNEIDELTQYTVSDGCGNTVFSASQEKSLVISYDVTCGTKEILASSADRNLPSPVQHYSHSHVKGLCVDRQRKILYVHFYVEQDKYTQFSIIGVYDIAAKEWVEQHKLCPRSWMWLDRQGNLFLKGHRGELAKIAGGKITHIDQESKKSAVHCLPFYTQNGVYATVTVPDGKTFILSMVNGVLRIYDKIK